MKKPGRLTGLFGLVLILVGVVPLAQVLIYRVVPAPITILMIERLFEGKGLRHDWRPIDRISPHPTGFPLQGCRFGRMGRRSAPTGRRGH